MISHYFTGDQKPTVPLTPVVEHNDLFDVSGQGTSDPETGEKYIGDDITKQTRFALANLKIALEAAGSTPENIVKITIFTTAIDRLADINEAYVEFFGDTYPARSAVGVAALAGGMHVEIEAIAAK